MKVAKAALGSRTTVAVAALITFPAWLMVFLDAATREIRLADGFQAEKREVPMMAVSVLPVALMVVLAMLFPTRTGFLGVALVALTGLILTVDYVRRYEWPSGEADLFVVAGAALGVVLALSCSLAASTHAGSGPVA